jgi:hypothetical protein
LAVVIRLHLKSTKALGLIQPVSYPVFNISFFFFKKNCNLGSFFCRYILIRKINGFLKISLISKLLEGVLFFLIKIETCLKITSIFTTKGLTRLPLFGPRINNPGFRFNFFILFLAFVYRNSLLVSTYISALIFRGKQHRKVLGVFTNFVEKVVISKFLTLSGLQLRVTGKIGGRMRKSKYHYKLGLLRLQSLCYAFSYSCTPSFTRFGIISVKV